MPRMTKTQHLANIHTEALARFDKIQSALFAERQQCLQDLRFYSIPGAQWEGPLGEQFENKPKFEVNKVHLAVIRIINEYRNNRISVDFVSKDGSQGGIMADVCDGLYRADEQDSCAEEAYDNAFEEAVGGGFGAIRLRAAYEDEYDDTNERQRIRIEPIYDADSCVFFDLAGKRQDKSDAKYCFVLTSMTPEAYREEWDDDPSSWPKEISKSEFDWCSPDLVYVAEYYRVEETREVMHVFMALDGTEERFAESEFEEDPDLKETLRAKGYIELRQRPVRQRKVRKYILSGGGILEDCGYIAGTQIPIVPVYAKRWFVDGLERCMGHVRLAKDAQRLKNMQLSKLGEISALSSVEKPILTPEQIMGHQVMWSEDNIKNFPYLLINPITDAAGQSVVGGPVAYTKSAAIPPAMAALLQLTEQDMQEILGNPQNAEKMVSHITNKNLDMVQSRLDMQSFIYMSNFAKAVRRCGEVWLSMAKELYAEPGRTMKTLDIRGSAGAVTLMKPMVDKETSQVIMENDLTQASFDVVADVGPASVSKREATVRSLTGMLAIAQDPETQQILQSMIMMNMESEGISEIREFFRKRLIRMGAVRPTDEEARALEAERAAQGPDPNTQYLEAAAAEAIAKATKARVDALETLANTDLKKAQTVETLAGIDMEDQRHAMDMVGMIKGDRPAMGEKGRM